MKAESVGTYLHLVCVEPGEKTEVAPVRDWTDPLTTLKDQDMSEHGVHSVQWWNDERAAHVQRLRARVQSGTYRIDSVSLAQRLLEASKVPNGSQ